MNAVLLPEDRTRLARMLGSSFDGEVVNAARLASRLLRDRGLTWPDVLETPPAIAAPVERPVQDDFAVVLAAFPTLTAWEQKFVVSLRRQRRWSPKQREKLRDIAERVAGGAR